MKPILFLGGALMAGLLASAAYRPRALDQPPRADANGLLETSLVHAQQARNGKPLPKDPDALVALMAGENLPSTAMNRRIPNTPGWRAARTLMRMKDAAVPALAKGLKSDDRSIRLNSVYVLGNIGTPATLALRIKAASDRHPQVRAQAVAGLPAYKRDQARRTLLNALKDPDPAVRNAAINAFRPLAAAKLPGNFIRLTTAKSLIPLLDDLPTQSSAARVLGQLGNNVAARPLLKLIMAKDKWVRYAAIEALGKLKDKQVAVELTAALSDEDTYVRMYAIRSLGQIGDLRTTPALIALLSDKDPYRRRDTAGALGQIGDLRAVTGLLPLLKDPNEQVRYAAAEALGQIGDVRAVEPLCKLLTRNGRENSSVARALGRLRDPRAIEPLTRFLLAPDSHSTSCIEAAEALARIRHPDSVAALVKVILNTRNVNNRHKARLVLGKLTGGSFSHQPNETIVKWWKLNRKHYLRPIPDKK